MGGLRVHSVAGRPDDAPVRSIWRFAQHSVHRLGAFNGDPHPGNYRFSPDGDVTFLDFGLVKRWTPGGVGAAAPSLDAIVVHRDPERLVGGDGRGRLPAPRPRPGATRSTTTSARRTRHTSPTLHVHPRRSSRDGDATIVDVKGPHAEVIEKLNMPPSFVILDRVVWGCQRMLGRLRGDGALAGDVARVPRRRHHRHATRRGGAAGGPPWRGLA